MTADLYDDRAAGWPLTRRELFMIFAFWTSLAILSVANRFLDPRGPGLQFGAPTAPIALAFIESWMWALLTPLIFWLSSRYSVVRTNWVVPLIVCLIAGVIVAAFADALFDFARFSLLRRPSRRGATFLPFRGVAQLWFLNEFFIYVAILVTGFAREYYRQFRRRQSEAVLLRAQTSQLQAQLAVARLEALQMQLNPHFLFNTLHAISALVERDPAGVRRMITRLSELMRYVLEGSSEPEVRVEDEVDFLKRYLEIMEIRFQGRLEVAMNIDPAAREALVPNLILQAIVENAIKHGTSRVSGVGRLELEAVRRGDRLTLRVRDNGTGFDEGSAEGVGLRNTRARLEQLYGTEQKFEVRNEDGFTVAEIEIPFHTRADFRASGVASE